MQALVSPTSTSGRGKTPGVSASRASSQGPQRNVPFHCLLWPRTYRGPRPWRGPDPRFLFLQFFVASVKLRPEAQVFSPRRRNFCVELGDRLHVFFLLHTVHLFFYLSNPDVELVRYFFKSPALLFFHIKLHIFHRSLQLFILSLHINLGNFLVIYFSLHLLQQSLKSLMLWSLKVLVRQKSFLAYLELSQLGLDMIRIISCFYLNFELFWEIGKFILLSFHSLLHFFSELLVFTLRVLGEVLDQFYQSHHTFYLLIETLYSLFQIAYLS